MNNTIETILNHRSIRSFTDELLTAEEIDTLVKSAQAASTSSYVQAYSIIGVTDKEKSGSWRHWPETSLTSKITGTCLCFALICTAIKTC